jgi:hypothetical protein
MDKSFLRYFLLILITISLIFPACGRKKNNVHPNLGVGFFSQTHMLNSKMVSDGTYTNGSAMEDYEMIIVQVNDLINGVEYYGPTKTLKREVWCMDPMYDAHSSQCPLFDITFLTMNMFEGSSWGALPCQGNACNLQFPEAPVTINKSKIIRVMGVSMPAVDEGNFVGLTSKTVIKTFTDQDYAAGNLNVNVVLPSLEYYRGIDFTAIKFGQPGGWRVDTRDVDSEFYFRGGIHDNGQMSMTDFNGSFQMHWIIQENVDDEPKKVDFFFVEPWMNPDSFKQPNISSYNPIIAIVTGKAIAFLEKKISETSYEQYICMKTCPGSIPSGTIQCLDTDTSPADGIPDCLFDSTKKIRDVFALLGQSPNPAHNNWNYWLNNTNDFDNDSFSNWDEITDHRNPFGMETIMHHNQGMMDMEFSSLTIDPS